jgi:glycosyltransferase involved in cell wall biosynthesis
VVTLLITGLGKGGAENQLVALAKHLRSCGWDTEVISLLPPTQFVDHLADAGVQVWSAGLSKSLRDLPALLMLLRHLRHRRPQVLCTFMFHANVIGRILGRIAGVPVVISSIRNERFGSAWREWLEAATRRLADAIVVNSANVLESLARRNIVRREECCVIPNAVNLDRFNVADTAVRAKKRREFGIDKEFLWLAVGRLEFQKDYASLLCALARLSEKYSTVRLMVAGDGPLREQLQTMAREWESHSIVTWLGLRDDVPDLMGAADGFVLASAWEGSPNAVLEALATETAVVATDVGGTRELVGEGQCGFLVPPGDADALAVAMEKLMTLSVDERRDMGRRGRERMRECHDAVSVLETWRRLFLDALTKKAGAAG